MLYIFLVNTGQMRTFDMNIAVKSVQDLQSAIYKSFCIPIEKQVLLISGGTVLDPKERVCNYSAGADTNPIFLFDKSAIESMNPPTFSIDNLLGLEFEERVQAASQLQPSIQTVQSYVQLAKNFHEKAEDELKLCESLVSDQHLQQQGWAAAVANFDDITADFQKNVQDFHTKFLSYLAKRDECIKYIDSVDDDIAALSNIPLLSSLPLKRPLSSSNALKTPLQINEQLDPPSSDSEIIQRITLLQFYFPKGPADLRDFWKACSQDLERFSPDELATVMSMTELIQEQIHNSRMKEIKGIEDRFSCLERYRLEASNLVFEQGELALALRQNQNRARNLKDDSILPDLCSSHIDQLINMQDKHKQLLKIYRSCLKAKEEFSQNLHSRLRWITFIQERIAEQGNKILAYNSKLNMMKKDMDIINQIHGAPAIYLKAIHEVVRRKIFSDAYLNWAQYFSESVTDIHDKEISLRRSFNSQFSGQILQLLFPGLEDMPPSYAKICPKAFDDRLPKLTLDDIRKLLEESPEVEQYHDFSDVFGYNMKLQFLFQTTQCQSVLIQTNYMQSEVTDKSLDNEPSVKSDDAEIVGDETRVEIGELDHNDSKVSVQQLTTDNVIMSDQLTCSKRQLSSVMKAVEERDSRVERLEEELRRKSELLAAQMQKWNKVMQGPLGRIKQELDTLRSAVTDDLDRQRLFYGQVVEEVGRALGHVTSEAEKAEQVISELRSKYDEASSSLAEEKEKSNHLEAIVVELRAVVASQQGLLDDKTMVKQMTLEHELELEAIRSELIRQLNERDVQLAEVSISLADVVREREALEATMGQQIQAEKDKIVSILETSYRERERSLKESLEQVHVRELEDSLACQKNRIRQEMAAEFEITLEEAQDRLRQEMEKKEAISVDMAKLEAEEHKMAMLKEVRDQMLKDHRQEMDSLRARFKLVASNLEKSSSDIYLEKHEKEFIDLATHNKLMSEVRAEMELQCQEAVEEAKRSIRAKFYRLDSSRRHTEGEGKKRSTKVKIARDALIASMTDHDFDRDVKVNKMLQKAFREKEEEMKRLMTKSCIEPSSLSETLDVDSCVMTSTISELSDIKGSTFDSNSEQHSDLLHKTKQIFEECLKTDAVLAQLFTDGVIKTDGCRVGDIVLALWDEHTKSYIIHQDNSRLHFVHHAVLQNMGINTNDSSQRPAFVMVKVISKEFCRIVRDKNRLNLPKFTQFYRVRGCSPGQEEVSSIPCASINEKSKENS